MARRRAHNRNLRAHEQHGRKRCQLRIASTLSLAMGQLPANSILSAASSTLLMRARTFASSGSASAQYCSHNFIKNAQNSEYSDKRDSKRARKFELLEAYLTKLAVCSFNRPSSWTVPFMLVQKDMHSKRIWLTRRNSRVAFSNGCARSHCMSTSRCIKAAPVAVRGDCSVSTISASPASATSLPPPALGVPMLASSEAPVVVRPLAAEEAPPRVWAMAGFAAPWTAPGARKRRSMRSLLEHSASAPFASAAKTLFAKHARPSKSSFVALFTLPPPDGKATAVCSAAGCSIVAASLMRASGSTAGSAGISFAAGAEASKRSPCALAIKSQRRWLRSMQRFCAASPSARICDVQPCTTSSRSIAKLGSASCTASVKSGRTLLLTSRATCAYCRMTASAFCHKALVWWSADEMSAAKCG
mmetsp:Transcript_93316/g.260916  ORF Transcript_93316/g.260916 Transcript_93316/m.260916 type:complete len:417 (+) Transcript_93316:134-1384(+)